MYNYAFGLLTSVMAFLYVAIFLKDSLQIRNERLRKKEEKGEKLDEDEKTLLQYATQDHSNWQKFKKFFDVDNLKSGFQAICRDRPHGQKSVLFLLIFSFQLVMFNYVGFGSHFYLYLRRVLDFDLESYTNYSVAMGFIGIFSQFVALPLMSAKLKLRDSSIIIIELLGKSFEFIIKIIGFCTLLSS